jgi:heme exporter protein CcmD
MDGSAPYVLGGYAAALLPLGAYALWVVRRGKRLSRRVAPDRRRWSSS